MGASICKPRSVCWVTKLKTFGPLPNDRAATMMRMLVLTAVTRMRQRPCVAMMSAPTSAAGHTLIQAAMVRMSAATRGRVAANITPTMASGTVIESMRPIAIGPSSNRKPIHHQAAAEFRLVLPHPMIAAKPTASSTMTMLSQVLAYMAGPNASAASMGKIARIGYTQALWMPTQKSAMKTWSVQNL